MTITDNTKYVTSTARPLVMALISRYHQYDAEI